MTLVSLDATAYQDGISIEWRTGLEVDNLASNLYRNEGGKPTRINSQLALKFGNGVTIGSGRSYAFAFGDPSTRFK